MDKISMFETLLKLPLFQGASIDRMAHAVGSVKFDFLRFVPDTPIINPGDECTKLSFVLGGTVRLTVSAPNHELEVSQTLTGPDVIMPDFLFGMNTRYPYSVTTTSAVSILRIEKADYMTILTLDPVFLINALNYLSAGAQKPIADILPMIDSTFEKRIAFIVRMLTQSTATDIVIRCSDEHYEKVFGLNFTDARPILDKLTSAGLITYTPNTITIPNRKHFLQHL